jgi:hypothetical protein
MIEKLGEAPMHLIADGARMGARGRGLGPELRRGKGLGQIF